MCSCLPPSPTPASLHSGYANCTIRYCGCSCVHACEQVGVDDCVIVRLTVIGPVQCAMLCCSQPALTWLSVFASLWPHTHLPQPCHVVYTDRRPVPLQHYIFPANADGVYLVLDEKVRSGVGLCAWDPLCVYTPQLLIVELCKHFDWLDKTQVIHMIPCNKVLFIISSFKGSVMRLSITHSRKLCVLVTICRIAVITCCELTSRREC